MKVKQWKGLAMCKLEKIPQDINKIYLLGHDNGLEYTH